MRVVWKDSHKNRPETGRIDKYRGVSIIKTENGWITDDRNDPNEYPTREIAQNAVDRALGPRKSGKIPKRAALGIKVVGKRSDAS